MSDVHVFEDRLVFDLLGHLRLDFYLKSIGGAICIKGDVL